MPEGAQEGGDVLAALAVDPHTDGVPLVDVELEPGAAARDDLGGEQVLVGGLVERLGRSTRPGERTSWLTTTRSVPLMMKTPFSVIIGKSPRKTCCSLISPVSRLMNRAVTKSGWRSSASCSLASSMVSGGSPKRCSVNSSARYPVKSSIGEISSKISFRPFSRNHLKDSCWTASSSGRGSTSGILANDRRWATREVKGFILLRAVRPETAT